MTHTKDEALKLALEALQALAAPVQEPVWIQPDHLQKAKTAPFLCRVEPHKRDDFVPLYTTPPAAQPAQPAPPECQTEAEKTAFAFGWWQALESVRQPAVPDAFGTREGEHPQYVQGWNDCRAEMLKGMK
jgi:hypothetical protein